MKEVELAWSAGFLDGEGNFGTYLNNKVTLRFRIQACQVHREPLDRLCSTLGGTVRGPYGPYSGNRKPYYSWAVEGMKAQDAVAALSPYLCAVKVEQAYLAMEKLCVS